MARRIERINSQKPKWRRRRCLPPLLLAFIGVLAYITIFMARLAWKVHNNIHEASRASNFVEVKKNATNARRVAVQKKNKQQTTSSIVDGLIDRSHRVEIPDQDRTLAFVHIGKSGGSTLSLLLRNGCMTAVDGEPCEPDRWQKIPGQLEETIASKRIQFYLHTPHVESGKMAEYYRRVSSVVIVARDPLERFVSAFLSRHPKNIDFTRHRNFRIRAKATLEGADPPVWAKATYGDGDRVQDQIHREAFKGCYPSVEQFAECAGPSPPERIVNRPFETRIKWNQKGEHVRDISLNCREICLGIASGESEFIRHLHLNYEAFLKDLPAESEVFVLRTSKLWDDWLHINHMLGSKRSVDIPDTNSDEYVVNARGKMPVQSNMSRRGRKIICEKLSKEIRIYVGLLNRAVNLSDGDVRSALLELWGSCQDVVESLIKDVPKQ